MIGSLEVEIEEIKRIVEEIGPTLDKDEDWSHVAIFWNSDGERATLPLSYGTEMQKDIWAFMILPMLIKDEVLDVQMCALVQPSWALSVTRGEMPELPPSEHPDRVEVLFLSCFTNNDFQVWNSVIDRSGEHPQLVRWEMLSANAEDFAGRFIDPIREAFESRNDGS